MEQKNASAPIIGAVFGAGIAISGMGNPAKVLNFFDMAGSFEPSVIFVMANALVVTALGYSLVFRAQSAPVFATRFDLRTGRKVDLPLVAGSAVFGIGWGTTGSAQAAPYRCLASAMPRRRSSSLDDRWNRRRAHAAHTHPVSREGMNRPPNRKGDKP